MKKKKRRRREERGEKREKRIKVGDTERKEKEGEE